MADYTTNLNLLKKDPDDDGNDYFNIETMLNDNWDKIDAGVAAKETPAGAQAKVDNLAGAGRTTQTVKGNADAINALNQTVTVHSAEDATTAAKGHVQLAINAEVTTGTNTTKAVTPSGVKVELDKKINHSLATAVNDFLVSSGAGAFVKKTLAEVKTILGLGSAAYTASTAYATAAQGTLATNALPKSGGIMTGEINCADQPLTRPYIKDYAEVLGTVPATTGTVTLNLETGNTFNLTPTGAVIIAITNPPTTGRAGSFTLQINMPATLYAITFPVSFKWDGDEIPTFTASKTAIITGYTIDGGTKYRVGAFGTKFTT